MYVIAMSTWVSLAVRYTIACTYFSVITAKVSITLRKTAQT